MDIRTMLEQVRDGKMQIEEAERQLRDLPYEDLGFAKLDHHRSLRTGFGEVVYCEGKTIEHLVKIFRHFADREGNVLGTRASQAQFEAVRQEIPDAEYDGMMELYGSLVDLEPLLHKTVRQMSLGQRTLSDILAAFLHNPGIVFLDEPTIGLDVSMKAKIRELIKELNRRKKTTVILTTHDMGDVDALCQRIVIIDHGKMIYDNDMEHLKTFFGSYRTLKLRLPGDVWEERLIDESKTDVMGVISEYQKKGKILDIKLEEISTEEVIKKIYEGGSNEYEKIFSVDESGDYSGAAV